MATAEEPKFLIFGKTGWIGGLVGEELQRQVRRTGSRTGSQWTPRAWLHRAIALSPTRT
jgi:hypothetical protein